MFTSSSPAPWNGLGCLIRRAAMRSMIALMPCTERYEPSQSCSIMRVRMGFGGLGHMVPVATKRAVRPAHEVVQGFIGPLVPVSGQVVVKTEIHQDATVPASRRADQLPGGLELRMGIGEGIHPPMVDQTSDQLRVVFPDQILGRSLHKIAQEVAQQRGVAAVRQVEMGQKIHGLITTMSNPGRKTAVPGRKYPSSHGTTLERSFFQMTPTACQKARIFV